MIAEVIVNSNAKELDKTFDYSVPLEMQEKIKIGSRVLVSFGSAKRLEEAFVINLKESTTYKTKNIAKLQEGSLSKEKINLAKWMANRYFCNLSDSIKLMLPPGTTTRNFEKRVKKRNVNFVRLKKEKEEILKQIEENKIKSDKHIRVLKFLIQNEDTSLSDLQILTDTSRAVIKTLEKNEYIEIIEKQIERNPFVNKKVEKNKKLKLTKEQQNAYNKIEEAIDDKMNSNFLIFGVTGSRKNRNIFAINRESFKRK